MDVSSTSVDVFSLGALLDLNGFSFSNSSNFFLSSFNVFISSSVGSFDKMISLLFSKRLPPVFPTQGSVKSMVDMVPCKESVDAMLAIEVFEIDYQKPPRRLKV